MFSLMLILLAVFAFVCTYFFLEAKDDANATIACITGVVLFMVGFFNFINYFLEVLRWKF